MSSNQIINREEQNKFSNSNSNLSIKPSTDKPSSDSLNRTNSNTPASLNTNTNSRYSQLPQLNPFKRKKINLIQASIEMLIRRKLQKDHNEDVLPNHRNTYYLLGSVILLAILALIATYFVKRKSESKNEKNPKNFYYHIIYRFTQWLRGG